MKVKVINATVLQVSWKGGKGNHTGYKVRCVSQIDPDANRFVDVCGLNDESVVVDGLHPGMTYQVSVTSVANQVASPEEPPGGTSVTLREFYLGIWKTAIILINTLNKIFSSCH